MKSHESRPGNITFKCLTNERVTSPAFLFSAPLSPASYVECCSLSLSLSRTPSPPPFPLLRPFPSIRHNSLPEFVDRVVVRVDVDLGRSIPRGSERPVACFHSIFLRPSVWPAGSVAVCCFFFCRTPRMVICSRRAVGGDDLGGNDDGSLDPLFRATRPRLLNFYFPSFRSSQDNNLNALQKSPDAQRGRAIGFPRFRFLRFQRRLMESRH